MRMSPVVLAGVFAALLVPLAAQAAKPHHHSHAAEPRKVSAAGPKKLGTFEDWIAATHAENGATVCYAFAYPSSSAPKLPGRGEVVLTVTERPAGRDEVALSAGFTFAQNAAVTVQVDQTSHDFYTAQRNAFARDGKAVVAAFHKGSNAVARSSGPHNADVVDTFSLRGFSAAYAAITKACPGS